MGGRRISNHLALGLFLASTTGCAPTVTIADESAEGGGAGEASGGSGNKGGSPNDSGGTPGVGGGVTGGASSSGGDGTGGVGPIRIHLYDAAVHRSVVTLSIPIVDTASGVDIELCWSGATSDLACADVDPLRHIDRAEMMRFNRSEQDVEQLLAQGELAQEDLDGYLGYETAHDSTCTTLSSLTNFGTPVDVFEEYVEDDRSYLFTFNRGTNPFTGTVTMVFANPSTSSTNMRISAPPGCGIRTITTDLTTIQYVPVPFDGPWIVDWSNVTVDGQGNEFRPYNLDRVTLWFVAGSTASELEYQVTELDSIATESYDAEIAGGFSIDLAQLSNSRDGRPFSSFRTNEAGAWLFGLRCSGCMNGDLPQVLSVFGPVEAR
jgi:hypothetical protein